MTKCVWLGPEPLWYGGFSKRRVIVGTVPLLFFSLVRDAITTGG